MVIYVAIFVAFLAGYFYGYKIRPNKRLRKAFQDVKEKYEAVLEEGNKGIYRTIVSENNKSSELTVEIKELAVTASGFVKVQYLSAYYKNPEFRTKKGEALLTEVHSLLGEYLPKHEIEWFENGARNENIKNHLNSLSITYRKKLGA